jgi:DNA-binding NtrC family response regulator
VGQILVSWIGKSDLCADGEHDLGPVLRFLRDERGSGFQRLYFWNDLPAQEAIRCRRGADWYEGKSPEEYVRWLAEQTSYDADKFVRIDADGSLRNDLERIWNFTVRQLKKIIEWHPDDRFTFLLSAGYPAAQTALVVASQTLFTPRSVRLYTSSLEAGVHEEVLPFELSLGQVLKRAETGDRPPAEPGAFARIIGTSPAIRVAKQQALRIAPYHSEFRILLLGEAGTGKDLFAEAIHRASPRGKTGNFVTLNCAAITETLAEAELFGVLQRAVSQVAPRPGAVKEADGGTLFLDEIGLMPIEVQAKLLRFLQSGAYRPVGADNEVTADVWVIAATNRDLHRDAAQRLFLPDLLDRIDDFTIRIPPLRERLEDVPELAERFLERSNACFKQCNPEYTEKRFSGEALQRLQQHLWPGNVRKLEQCVKQLALLTEGPQIMASDVESILGSPELSYGFGLPLGKMSAPAFMNQLAATVDELIIRYNDAQGLPTRRETDVYDIQDEILDPLLFGRARDLANSDREAGFLLRRTSGGKTLEFRGGAENARQRYNQQIKGELIDEAQVQLILHGMQQ